MDYSDLNYVSKSKYIVFYKLNNINNIYIINIFQKFKGLDH